MAFLIIVLGMITASVFAYLDKTWLSGATLVAIIAAAVAGYLQKDKKPKDGE